jgi:hypothetical protein
MNARLNIATQNDSKDNTFILYPPVQNTTTQNASTWVIGCFNGNDGIQYFKLVNTYTSDTNLAVNTYC